MNPAEQAGSAPSSTQGGAVGAAARHERELAGARAEAAGAADAVVRLQLQLGEARAELAAVERTLDGEREQHARRLRETQALAHAALAAGRHAERDAAEAAARAQEELSAVQAAAAFERDSLHARIASLQQQREAAVADARQTHDETVADLRRELEDRDRRLRDAARRTEALQTRVEALAEHWARERTARVHSDATVEQVLETSAALLRQRQDALAAQAAGTTAPASSTAVAASDQPLARLEGLREDLLGRTGDPGAALSPESPSR